MRRLATIALALAFLLAVTPPAHASTTLACTPPATLAAQVQPCTVTGFVRTGFQMKVFIGETDYGPIELEALYRSGGPGQWKVYTWVCTNAIGLGAACAGGVPFGLNGIGPGSVGTYDFTARPLVVDAFQGHPDVRLEVVVW